MQKKFLLGVLIFSSGVVSRASDQERDISRLSTYRICYLEFLNINNKTDAAYEFAYLLTISTNLEKDADGRPNTPTSEALNHEITAKWIFYVPEEQK